MILVIRALSLDNRPLSEPLVGTFGASGGTIGRSDTNTIALPDPERHISRLQAEITVEGHRYLIRNAGAANPILLNGRALSPDERAKLAHGDELRIGGYVLSVQFDGSGPLDPARASTDAHTVITASAGEHRTDPPPLKSRSRPVTRAPMPAPAPVATAGNPFADLLAPAPPSGPNADPFAFLGTPAMAGPAAPAPRMVSPSGAPAQLPDDFDPFADLMAAPPVAAPAATPSGPSGAPDLLASIGASSGTVSDIDAAFGLGAPSAAGASDPLAAFMSGAAGAAPASGPDLGGSVSTDPLAMFGGAAAASAAGPAIPAAFNHTAELAGAYTPPRILSEPPRAAPMPAPPPAPAATPAPMAPRPMPRAAPAAASGADGDRLWAGFCEGAGIRLELPQGLSPEQMKIVGQILREAIDGTLRLMTIRATTKNELRAQMTTIKSKNNNPLKFSPTAQQAVEQLLQPPLRGFTAGPVAMQDAMHDLVGHSIGTMAGMRAALAGVLGRFQPQELESKLAGKSMLDSLMPMNRKARLWDLYLQHFESIRGEAQDDFHTLFGKAFVEAYEDQLDRLSNEKAK
jgi:FHA domain-containing protein